MSEKLPNSQWNEYVEGTKGQEPRKDLIEALPYIIRRNEALDLGAGALNDSQYLLKEGFLRVTAVDKESNAAEIAAKFPADRFEYIISSFETFDFPDGKYDIVNAQYALPFTPPENFDAMFANMKRSLAKDGVFAGQLFGERDEWNIPSRNMKFHTKTDAEKLFSGMETLKFEEEENDARTATSPTLKHWHVFHVIAKKK